MRWVALGLVLLNGFVLAWYLGKPAAPVDPTMDTPPGPTLTTLAELSPAQRPVARTPLKAGELPAGVALQPEGEGAGPMEAAAPVPPTALGGQCFRVGYFADERAVDRALQRVKAAGGEVGAPVVERYERTRYWVLLPAAPTREQALAVVARLRRAGVTDYYLIPNGENKNVLSLGMFSTRPAAQRRLAEIGRLKLKVRVEEVKVPAKRYSFEAHWPGPDTPPWDNLLPAQVSAEAGTCSRNK